MNKVYTLISSIRLIAEKSGRIIVPMKSVMGIIYQSKPGTSE